MQHIGYTYTHHALDMDLSKAVCMGHLPYLTNREFLLTFVQYHQLMQYTDVSIDTVNHVG